MCGIKEKWCCLTTELKWDAERANVAKKRSMFNITEQYNRSEIEIGSKDYDHNYSESNEKWKDGMCTWWCQKQNKYILLKLKLSEWKTANWITDK